MTPWQKAQKWQGENDATIEFSDLVAKHLLGGYVWSTPQVFLLASEARWDAEKRSFETGDPNCWFVRLAAAAGHANAVGELLRVAPHPHEYVGWFRRNQFEPRIYRWNSITRKVKGQ